MNNTLIRLRLLGNFMSLVRDPLQTQKIFEMTELGRELKGPLSSVTMKKVSAQEGFQDLYSRNFTFKMPTLPALLAYPKGSFGREFAEHMKANHLDVEFFPDPSGVGSERYFVERARKSHDLWHVLTGYGAGVVGEIGLQSFSLAQLRSPISAIILAGGILHTLLKDPAIYESLIDHMFEGYEMGRRARPLIGLPIETYLDENLDSLRARLQITPTAFEDHSSMYAPAL
jgi:ubiquinone biosynthesis protein Coq4